MLALKLRNTRLIRLRKKLKRSKLSENGYKAEFEASVLREARRLKAGLKSGKARAYDNMQDFLKDLNA